MEPPTDPTAPTLPTLPSLSECSSTPVVQPAVDATQIQLEEHTSKLTPQPKEVFNQLYETAKADTKEHVFLSDMDITMKIGKMMSTIIKLVEKTTYHGVEKREMALAMGKRLVSDPAVFEIDDVRYRISIAYDMLGEQLLETLVDVSRYVNTAAALSCFESIMLCMKK